MTALPCPSLAANLSMLFTELPFLERFAAARAAGFTAVECQFLYAWPKEDIKAALAAQGQRLVLFNLPAGNWDGGERGIACLPDRVAEFREGVKLGIDSALTLGCPRLNCLAGIKPADLDAAAARATLVANLRYAATEFKQAGLTLLIEPINPFDIPGFFVNTTAASLALLDAVGMDNFKLQYDIYHAQRVEGELANTIRAHLARIGHMQVADNPGRHEPGTGEINFAWLLPFIRSLGYTGEIGCEYKPATNTVAGLGWLDAYSRG